MTKEEIILTEDENQMLSNLAQKYDEVCAAYKTAEAEKKTYGDMLKQLMKDYGITKFKNEDIGLSLSMSTRSNVSYDEAALIKILKQNEKDDGVVKTKEYVDMEALEASLYRGEIAPDLVKPSLVVKPDIVSLTCKPIKPKQLLTEG